MRSLERALVCGGAGFLGGWLVEALLRVGAEVTVVDRRPAPVLPLEVELVCAELAEVELGSLLAAGGYDAVFQLAGSGSVPDSLDRPGEDLEANAASTLALLEALRRAARPPLLLFVSSAAVYGEGLELPMGEQHPQRPLSPYGVSKLAAERYVALYAHLYGLAALSVRPFSLYGPGQRKLAVHDLLARLLRGEDPLWIQGSSEVTRDFVYAGDAAEMLVRLAKAAPARGEAYNVCSGRAVSLGELARLLVGVSGSAADVRFSGSVRHGDPRRWQGDPRRAQALGARAATSLEDGLRATCAWLTRAGSEVAA